MAFSYDDDEGEPPLTRSQAEITLKHLLDKQLSTTARLEQLEFQQGTESMHSLVHGTSGISSLQEFVKSELAQKQLLEKTRLLQNVLDGMGFSKKEVQERCQRISCFDKAAGPSSENATKRKRYGADPLFLMHSEAEDRQIASLECEQKLKEELAKFNQPILGHHSKELETKGKDRPHAISYLSEEALSCRKPLLGVAERISEQLTMTPQDRARCNAELESSRLINEVFSRPAPQVLDLHAYLKQRAEVEPECADATSPRASKQCEQPATSEEHLDSVIKVSEDEIIRNRLSEDEIRTLPCGKFVNYSPGNPSHVLYIKNLSKDVMEADLVSLFLRFQDRHQPLLFRLMKRGRMKGQAFITFADKGTSTKALQLLNGYNLRGKPMVIEFGHDNPGTSSASSKEADK